MKENDLNNNFSFDPDMSFRKLLANPLDRIVNDNPKWKQPKIGDHVRIISWDTQVDVKECVRICTLPYLTVKDVNPMVVGTGNEGYCWAYNIEVEETSLEFLQWHYEIIY